VTARGLSGLDNIGNTCYLNATLQPLSNTLGFTSYLLTDQYFDSLRENKIAEIVEERMKDEGDKCDDNKIVIKRSELHKRIKFTTVYQLSRVLTEMWKTNCTVVPKTLKDIITKFNKEFSGFKQNDTQEALNLILDRIHEETAIDVDIKFKNIPRDVIELNKIRKDCIKILSDEGTDAAMKQIAKEKYQNAKKKYPKEFITLNSYMFWKSASKRHSIITTMFTGIFCSHRRCTECEKVSVNFEPFTNLYLSIPESDETTLEECISNFSKEEVLDGDNKIKCSVCKKRVKSIKTMYIWELPEVLIIHMKRFNFNGTDMEKNKSLVKFPFENLELTSNQFDWHCDSSGYDLYSISEHRGIFTGGHYVAYCKNPIINKWYEMNDENVYHIPNDKIEEEIVTNNAYILFYSKNRAKKDDDGYESSDYDSTDSDNGDTRDDIAFTSNEES